MNSGGRLNQSANEATKDVADMGKSAGNAIKDIATSGGDPVAAATKIAKRELKELVTDPEKFGMKLAACIMICCTCVLSPFLFTLFLIITVFAWLFPGIVNNSASKIDGAAAYDSLIYIHSQMLDNYEDVMTADPEDTWIVSNDADYQRKLKQPIDEDSEEMLERIKDREPGVMDKYYTVYEEPSLDSYGFVDVTVGMTLVSEENEESGDFVKVKVSVLSEDITEDTDFDDVDAVAGLDMHDHFDEADETIESDAGFDNHSHIDRPEKVGWIHKKAVYKHEVPDAKNEITVQDEYHMMAKAMRDVMLAEKDKALEEGAKDINDEAEKEKYHKGDDLATLGLSEDYHENGGYEIIFDGMFKDGKIHERSPAKNPYADRFDLAKSMMNLQMQDVDFKVLNEQVSELLSGYAVAKANSVPEKGYFDNLDNILGEEFKAAYKYDPKELQSEKQSLSLSTAEFYEKDALVGMKISSLKWILRPFDEKLYKEGEGRYIRVTQTNQPFVLSNTLSDNALVLNKVTHKDFNMTGTLYIPSANGKYMLDTNPDDPTATSGSGYYSDGKKVKARRIIDVGMQDYEYTSYYKDPEISELDVEAVIAEFFANEPDFYPEMQGKSFIDKLFNNKKYQVIGKSSREIVPIEGDDNVEKFRKLKDNDYYPFAIAYIFDNKDLVNEGFVKDKGIYYKMESGKPLTPDEVVPEDELPEGATQKNTRRIVAEEFNHQTPVNNMGIQAKKHIFIPFISGGYKMEYRPLDEPEVKPDDTEDKDEYYDTDSYTQESIELIEQAEEKESETEDISQDFVDVDIDSDELPEQEEVEFKSIQERMDEYAANINRFLDDFGEYDVNVSAGGSQEVVELALSYVGQPGGVHFKKHMGLPAIKCSGTQYGSGGNDWCAAFTSTVLEEVGHLGPKAEMPISMKSASVTQIYDFHDERAEIKPGDGSYKPKPGDLVFYSSGGRGGLSHIGFVEKDNGDGTFSTIEGNTNGPGDRGNGCMPGDGSNVWWGTSANHKSKKYAANKIFFADLDYGNSGVGLAELIVELTPKAFNINFNTVDNLNRIGIGLWYEDEARELLKSMKAHDSELFNSLIASDKNGKDVVAFMNGGKQSNLSSVNRKAMAKVIGNEAFEEIQKEKLSERIEEILEDINSISDEGLDNRTQVYLALVQLAYDASGERDIMTNSTFLSVMEDAIDEGNDIITIRKFLKKEIFDKIPKRKNKKDASMYSYNGYRDLNFKEGVNKDFFFRDLRTSFMISKAYTVARALEDGTLNQGSISLNGSVITYPPGLGSFKSYMDYTRITMPGSPQMALQKHPKTTTNRKYGIRMHDGRYMVALSEHFWSVGDKVDIVLDTGKVINAIVGDVKAKADTDLNGIHSDNSIVEFIVDSSRMERITKQLGSFNHYPEFNGNVVELRGEGARDDGNIDIGVGSAGGSVVNTGGSKSGGFSRPLKAGIFSVSSEYGNRIHPTSGRPSFHHGIDLAAAGGTPVYAAKAGTVIVRQSHHSYGNWIAIDHGGGYETRYAHLSAFKVPRTGIKVKKGQLIGYVGTTGDSTGNHLHFEIRHNNNTRNPRNFLKL